MNIKKMLILAIGMVIIILIAIQIRNITTHTINDVKKISSHTRTICNESNFCQGYIIKCIGNELVDMSPVSNAAMQYPEDWEDPREEISQEDYCLNN